MGKKILIIKQLEKLYHFQKARTRIAGKIQNRIKKYTKITWILAGPHGMNSASFLSLIL